MRHEKDRQLITQLTVSDNPYQRTVMTNLTATKSIELFTYNDRAFRTFGTSDSPEFALADICDALEIVNSRNVAARLADDQKGVRRVDTLGGTQTITTVNESGLYEIVIRSDKPEAVAFRRWITGTVLPALRKTGTYSMAPTLTGSELLAAAVLEAQSMIAAKDAQIAELEPKADFFDELMDANGCYSMLAASKVIGWGRNVMMRDLRRLGIIQGNNLPYQRYEHHFKVVPGTYKNRKTGETVPTATTFVRPSGVEFLRKKLTQGSAVVGDAA